MPSVYTKILHNESDFCGEKSNNLLPNNCPNDDLFASLELLVVYPLTMQAMGVCASVCVFINSDRHSLQMDQSNG